MKRNLFWLPALALTGCLLLSGASAEEFFSESADSNSEEAAEFSEDFFAEAEEEVTAVPEEAAEEGADEVSAEIDETVFAEDAETLEERGIGTVVCPEGDVLTPPFTTECLTMHFEQSASNSIKIFTEDDKTMNKILSKNKWAVQFRIGEKYTGYYTSFPVKITGLIGNSIYNTLQVRLRTQNKSATSLPCSHFLEVDAKDSDKLLKLAVQKWFTPTVIVKYTAEDNHVVLIAPKLTGEAYKYDLFTYGGFLGYEVISKDGKFEPQFYDATTAEAYGSKYIKLPLTVDASTKVSIRAVVDTAAGETAETVTETSPTLYFSQWSKWVSVKAATDKWKNNKVTVTVAQGKAQQNKVTVKWSQKDVIPSSNITYKVEEVGGTAEPVITSKTSAVMDVENRTGKVSYKVTVLYNGEEGAFGTGSVTLKQTWDKTPVITAASEPAGYSEDGVDINVKITKQSGVTGYQIFDNGTELEGTVCKEDSKNIVYTVTANGYGTHSFTCKPMSGSTVGNSVSKAYTYKTVGQNWATSGISVTLKQTYTDPENATILVSWKRIPGADGYSIEVLNDSKEWEQVATVEDPVSSYELKTDETALTIGVRAMQGSETANSISSKYIKVQQIWNVKPKLKKVTPWSTTQKVTIQFTHDYRSTYKIYNINKEISESDMFDLTTSLDTTTGIEQVTVTVRVGDSYPKDNRLTYSLKVRVFGPNGKAGAWSETSTGYCKYNWKGIKLNVDYAQNKTSTNRGFWVIIRNPIPGITRYKFRVYNDADDKEIANFVTDVKWIAPTNILDDDSEASPEAVLARQWEGYAWSETDVTNPGKYYLKVNAVGPDGKLGKTTELKPIRIR